MKWPSAQPRCVSTWVIFAPNLRRRVPSESSGGRRTQAASGSGFLPPRGVAPERARDLQSPAVRGIQYWQRRPFELVIDTNPTSTAPADIEISWGEGLSGSQLGLTRVRWSLEKGEPRFEVLGLALAVRSPAGRRYELAPQQVLLTAAHEMGHALGLPHSDSERDVMYPTNTARSLSNRDFRTLAALYPPAERSRDRKNPAGAVGPIVGRDHFSRLRPYFSIFL